MASCCQLHDANAKSWQKQVPYLRNSGMYRHTRNDWRDQPSLPYVRYILVPTGKGSLSRSSCKEQSLDLGHRLHPSVLLRKRLFREGNACASLLLLTPFIQNASNLRNPKQKKRSKAGKCPRTRMHQQVPVLGLCLCLCLCLWPPLGPGRINGLYILVTGNALGSS